MIAEEILYPKRPYEDFANVIILKAVSDYRKALKRLKRNSENEHALERKKDCESFFLSKWYRVLTNLDGSTLIRLLKEESNND